MVNWVLETRFLCLKSTLWGSISLKQILSPLKQKFFNKPEKKNIIELKPREEKHHQTMKIQQTQRRKTSSNNENSSNLHLEPPTFAAVASNLRRCSWVREIQVRGGSSSWFSDLGFLIYCSWFGFSDLFFVVFWVFWFEIWNSSL